MNIEVIVNQAESTPQESALIELRVPNVQEAFRLDIDISTSTSPLHNISEISKDFLLIAAVIYGCDKAVDRSISALSEDRWKRDSQSRSLLTSLTNGRRSQIHWKIA